MAVGNSPKACGKSLLSPAKVVSIDLLERSSKSSHASRVSFAPDNSLSYFLEDDLYSDVQVEREGPVKEEDDEQRSVIRALAQAESPSCLPIGLIRSSHPFVLGPVPPRGKKVGRVDGLRTI